MLEAAAHKLDEPGFAPRIGGKMQPKPNKLTVFARNSRGTSLSPLETLNHEMLALAILVMVQEPRPRRRYSPKPEATMRFFTETACRSIIMAVRAASRSLSAFRIS